MPQYLPLIAIIVFGGILFTIAIVLVILNLKRDKAEQSAEQQIAMLISRVALMQVELTKKDEIIEEQKRRITFYTKQLEDVESRVRDLELILFGRNMGKDAVQQQVMKNPSLLLIGTDAYIERQDEIALNKTKMDYRRIFDATQNLIEQELRRARQQKTPYKFVMFSGHGSRNGWKMADGVMLDSYWMNQNLGDVDILYLNGCETTAIADDLVNVVGCVVSMDEKIPTKVAQSFAETFWKSIDEGKSPGEAFTEAQLVEPTTKPYATIRY